MVTVRPPAGRAKPNASNIAFSRPATAMPPSSPATDATTPTATASTHDRAHDLAAAGAERPQQRRLPRALRHEDREGVEDAERADQQRHAGEHRQEAVVSRSRKVALMSSMFSCVSDAPVIASVPGGQDRLQALDELVLRHAAVAVDEDRRRLVGAAGEVALRGGQGEGGERRPARAPSAVAVGGDADDAHGDRLGRLHDGGVADVQVAVLGGAAVDHDLVVGLGRAAFDDAVRVERRDRRSSCRPGAAARCRRRPCRRGR